MNKLLSLLILVLFSSILLSAMSWANGLNLGKEQSNNSQNSLNSNSSNWGKTRGNPNHGGWNKNSSNWSTSPKTWGGNINNPNQNSKNWNKKLNKVDKKSNK